jgi:hypothetical protein
MSTQHWLHKTSMTQTRQQRVLCCATLVMPPPLFCRPLCLANSLSQHLHLLFCYCAPLVWLVVVLPGGLPPPLSRRLHLSSCLSICWLSCCTVTHCQAPWPFLPLSSCLRLSLHPSHLVGCHVVLPDAPASLPLLPCLRPARWPLIMPPPLVAPLYRTCSVGCCVAQQLGLPLPLITSFFFGWLLCRISRRPGLPPPLIALHSYGGLLQCIAWRPGISPPFITPSPLIVPLLLSWLLRCVAQRPSLPLPLVTPSYCGLLMCCCAIVWLVVALLSTLASLPLLLHLHRQLDLIVAFSSV